MTFSPRPMRTSLLRKKSSTGDAQVLPVFFVHHDCTGDAMSSSVETTHTSQHPRHAADGLAGVLKVAELQALSHREAHWPPSRARRC